MGKNSGRVNVHKTLKDKEIKSKKVKILMKQPFISSTFQRPQPEPGMKEEVEDDNKMICVSVQVKFTWRHQNLFETTFITCLNVLLSSMLKILGHYGSQYL